jgi:hypothetical protein
VLRLYFHRFDPDDFHPAQHLDYRENGVKLKPLGSEVGAVGEFMVVILEKLTQH